LKSNKFVLVTSKEVQENAPLKISPLSSTEVHSADDPKIISAILSIIKKYDSPINPL